MFDRVRSNTAIESVFELWLRGVCFLGCRRRRNHSPSQQWWSLNGPSLVGGIMAPGTAAMTAVVAEVSITL